ncbi:MAG: primosomal protein N' [Clostridia bacterium]|nr:primosomal protein N' [Clostridia bacterium]
MKFANVIVDINHSEIDKVFEYSFTDENINIGSRVIVPFGNKLIEGIVVAVKNTSDYDQSKIKPIYKLLEEIPALTEETLGLMEYISKSCFVTKASALRLFLPSEMRKGKIKDFMVDFLVIKDDFNLESGLLSIKSNAVKQKELLVFLSENKKYKISELNKEFGQSAVKGVINKGFAYKISEKMQRQPYKELSSKGKSVTLTEKQVEALNSIENTNKTVSLLFGVTGSGKTEVYLNLINNVINKGKTAIMLVPEIALTPQMLSQLRTRFGDNAAILHSGLSAGERFDEWWRIRNGEAQIVIGARSAIFAPTSNVGIIIIDEEHDGSYFSESNPRYSTLQVALKRAEYNGAKIVLGSATPSIESFRKAVMKEYNLVRLPERINKRPLPEVEVIDMRSEVRRGNNSFVSSALKTELENCLNNGNQAIIFLNQRGYSKTVICTECGKVQKCTECDVSLTYHYEDNSLLCHYCGAKYKMIDSCTECGSKFLRYGGTGTEKVVLELNKMFPNAKILRMDRDSTQTKEGHFEILNKFSKQQADILVGTQMIAKGHDFPKVTLVGILDADMSLHFSDFRSAERTFQLITQVAGRSGRADQKGKVILQTYSPENSVLRQAINYDYESLYRNEISIRKATAFPPYTDIVRLLISSEKEEVALETTKQIYNELNQLYLENREDFRFFGCMKAPIKRLQNKFRYQILTRITEDNFALIEQIYNTSVKYQNKNVFISLELNPNNLS